jgi:hypothetical protein
MVAALLGLSVFSTLVGMAALIKFDQTAGPSDAAPPGWPSQSGIKRLKGRAEIVVFAHPFCSCTDATIAELEQLLARGKPGATRPPITVLFFRPRNSGWAPNGLWKKAQSLPEAHVVWDDGSEAKRFGARVSGYVLLYSPEGNLLFRGGITGSRGHRGDNYGLDELAASLDSNRPAHGSNPVFGCALGNLDEEMAGRL